MLRTERRTDVDAPVAPRSCMGNVAKGVIITLIAIAIIAALVTAVALIVQHYGGGLENAFQVVKDNLNQGAQSFHDVWAKTITIKEAAIGTAIVVGGIGTIALITGGIYAVSKRIQECRRPKLEDAVDYDSLFERTQIGSQRQQGSSSRLASFDEEEIRPEDEGTGKGKERTSHQSGKSSRAHNAVSDLWQWMTHAKDRNSTISSSD